MNKIRVVSLFSGAGGLDLGFEAAGAKIVFASDIMPEACETLRRNRRGIPVFGPPDFSGDIRDLSKERVLELGHLKDSEVDILIGGPPCQPFSVAAAQRFLKTDKLFKRKGYACEERGNLIFTFVALSLDIRPRVVLIENVPGILTIDKGESFKRIADIFARHGYKIFPPLLLDGKDYGVPQSRKRAFIVGFLGEKEFSPPPRTHGSDLFAERPFRTVAEALYGFSSGLPNSEVRNHNVQSTDRYKTLRVGQREKLGRVDRLDPRLPSKTVIAGGSAGGGRSHLHPYLARTLSVRECARLQTFPDDYRFYGSIGRQFTQAGNAVPPLLAEVLARHLLASFFDKKYKKRLKYAIRDISAEGADAWLKAWAIKKEKRNLYDDVK